MHYSSVLFIPLLLSAILGVQAQAETVHVRRSSVEGPAVDDVPLATTDAETKVATTNISFQDLRMSLYRALLVSTSKVLRSSLSSAPKYYYSSNVSGKRSENMNDETYKNPKNWEVLQLDPRGGTPCFANDHVTPEYASYDPPKGFTAEQIMQFDGAKELFASVGEIEKLIQRRDELGTLQGKVDS